MGKAYRTYKFQATAITRRKDRPLCYGRTVHAMDDHFIDVTMREACFLELAERIVPGLCIDTNIPMGMTDWGGVIFQVQKRRARDEGLQRNILSAALSISLGAKLGIVVDEDVDIYNMEDVMWALATRVNPKEDILTVAEGGFGQTFPPARLTFAQLDASCHRVAHFLAARGVTANERITLLGDNSSAFVTLFFGVIRYGATVNPLNAEVLGPDLGRILNDVAPRLILWD